MGQGVRVGNGVAVSMAVGVGIGVAVGVGAASQAVTVHAMMVSASSNFRVAKYHAPSVSDNCCAPFCAQ